MRLLLVACARNGVRPLSAPFKKDFLRTGGHVITHYFHFFRVIFLVGNPYGGRQSSSTAAHLLCVSLLRLVILFANCPL